MRPASGGGVVGKDLLVAVAGPRRRAWGWWQWVRVLLAGAGGVAVVLALAYFAYRRRFMRRPPPSSSPSSSSATRLTTTRAVAHKGAVAAMATTAGGETVEVAAAAGGLMSSVKGRRVSCATRGVVLEFDGAGAGGGGRRPRLVESAVLVLLQLARHTDLYLITECDDDSTEEAVRSLLASRGLFAAGLNPHKVLFCSTPLGRVHMARQLESHMHIDGNAAVAEGLQRHVARLGVVAPPERRGGGGGGEGVLWADTLSELFGESRK